MKKRIIALLLCVMMIFGMLANGAINVSDMKVSVYHNGNPATSVILPKGSEIELNAVNAVTGSASYQWQINVYGDLWVDISGATGLDLRVSYAMVASLLQGGAAKLRVEATAGETVAYSDAITVTVSEEDPNAAVAIPELDEDTYQVLPAPVASVYEVTPPSASPEVEETPAEEDVIPSAEPSVQPTTEPTVEPSVQPSAEPTVEPSVQPTTEPTVEPSVQPTTEPSAEPQTVEPEEETVEPSVEPSTAPVEETGLITTATAVIPRLNEGTEADTTDVELAQKVAVIIEYKFADGKTAANPWSATVEVGSTLNMTVNSPTVIGYTPDQASVTINEVIEGAKTITVTYNPAKVDYTVKHYKQNVSDDKYTLVEEITKQGYTEDSVDGGHENTYEGFYSLLYDTTTKIAADGSTVVEIYYDRYYYLMTFDLDGGYGVEPIYARYGAPVSAGTPTKAGYTFGGWTPEFNYSTMPAANTNFTAQWTAGNTTYDVVFWYENADDEHYSQAGVLNDQTAEAGAVVNGSSYANTNFTGRDSEHFTYSHADENVVVKGDGSTVVNVYFSRNVYTLTFNMGNWADDCSVEIHEHVDGCKTLECNIEEHDHATLNCTLSCSHTSHTLECYVGQYNGELETVAKPSNDLTSLGNGIYSYYSDYTTRYVLNIGNAWYQNEYGSRYSIELNCTHFHTDSCYSCGEIGHIHNDSCYEWICGKEEHYHSGNTCYLIVTRKYDADITDIWNNNPVKAVIDDGNAFRSSVTGDYYSFLEKMPGQDITLTASNDSGSKYTWYYYLEVLPGQDTTELTTRTDGGKTYYLYNSASRNAEWGLGLTYAEDYFPITGFTQRDNDVPDFDSNRKAYLYYTRNSYKLAFSNNGDIVEDKGGTFLYEADISGTNFTPDYPADLEPNAYVFEGWYTSPFYGDTKFEFTTTDEDGNTVKATMPAKDITLYARWVPTQHNVRLFPTQADAEAVTNQIGTTEVVDHGATATEPTDPIRGEYIFVGWFYMDGETEKAFDFSMPVNQDLDLYAKWSSNKLMEYTINYELENGTPVAEPTTGSALAGTTKTFEAKAGEELNEGYQSGYFPNTNSHSLVIDIEDLTKNEFTFIYVPKEELPYTVMYLEYDGDYVYDGTEKVLHEQKDDKTRDAIITETFVPVTGYMPDAYQKRLVLSADESQNVIIFWYVKDDVHAPVQIIHYIQNAEGEGYTEYQSTTDLNGVINNSYSADILSITGYDYDHATANGVAVTAADGKVTGTVTKEGLLLELYYNRELHPYEFKFLEQGTDEVLAESVTGTARYGSQVTQNAKNISGYTLVSEQAQEIIIQIEDGETAVKNVRIFYYTEQQVTINYVVSGPTGCGTVTDPSKSNAVGTTGSETFGAATGAPVGSTAAPADGFKFVGWFDNESGTGTALSEELNFVPTKSNDLWVDGTTYYAVFDYDVADMTIQKKVTVSDEDQTFVFNVTNSDGAVARVVINVPAGKEVASVTLKKLEIDTYTVTEDATWAWRYSTSYKVGTEAGNSITLTPGQTNTVFVSNTYSNDKWLGDNAYCNNVFDGVAD